MTCDKCKYFKVLYEPLRTEGALWDMGRAKCEKHNLITDFANHGKFKRLDTCENYDPLKRDKEHMEIINNVVNEFIRQQREYKERTLAEIITKYDFIVGSIECKAKLMEVLPEGANIVCSPYIKSPTTVFAIKKFDVMDLLSKP